MNIESSPLTIACKKEEIVSFISVPSNLNVLLPQDKISEFEADAESCKFKIQGGITISLVLDGNNDFGVAYKSGATSPFPFTLQIYLTAKETRTEGYLQFKGEVPVMVAMLAKNPLTALFNDMSSNLKNIMEQEG
jgi:hypothetical protein